MADRHLERRLLKDETHKHAAVRVAVKEALPQEECILAPESDHGDHDTSFRMYGRRWIIVFLFWLATVTNAIIWISFAPIATISAKYFGTSLNGITWFSLVFMILYAPSTVMTAGITDRFGPRTAITLACFGNALAGAFRWIATDTNESARTDSIGYDLALAGQVVGAIVQPVFLNLPARVSAEWFDHTQRNIATTIMAMGNLVGIASGQVLASLMVTKDGGMPSFLLTTFLVALVSFILTLLFFHASPPTHPTSSAMLRSDVRSDLKEKNLKTTTMSESHVLQFWEDSKAIFSNRSYVFLCIGFGIGLGLFNSLMTLVEMLVKPAGYTSDDAGLFVGAAIGAGLLSACVFGYIMDRTHAFVPMLLFGACMSTAACTFVMSSIRPNQHTLLLISFIVMGSFVTPLLPMALETATEVTYPIPEEVSCGYPVLIGNVMGVLTVFVMQSTAVDVYTTVFTPSAIIIVVGMLIATCSILGVEPHYKRLESEQARRANKARTVHPA